MRLVTRLPLLAVAAAALIASAIAARPPGPRVDLAKVRVADLTHSFDEKTIYWPNSPSTFKLTKLANLEEVPETGAWIVALPMKIAGGSGGPLRAVALLP